MVIIDNVIEFNPDFDIEEIAEKVVNKVMEAEGVDTEVEVDILITDEEEIKEYNNEYRDIDRATDVLSFPNLEWEVPGDFKNACENPANTMCINPETDLLLLGEICLCKERIEAQALEYGHSVLREYAFLIAHSCLHLLGYDHMEEEEAKIMEGKQAQYLEELGISR